jgi:GT2 family glycosyltransferase
LFPDKSNKNLKSGGDVEWGRRVFAYGYYQLYAEDASVRHPARFSLRELYKRTIRIAGGIYDRENLKNHSPTKKNLLFFKDLILNLRPPLRFVFNTFLDPRLPNLEKKFKVAVTILFVRYVRILEKIRLKAGASSARK